MKLSVSLPEEDVDFLDRYAADEGFQSRSAVVHKAVRMLRASQLSEAYTGAWEEWADTGNAERWESTSGDA